jgi:GAF domain-containing protein
MFALKSVSAGSKVELYSELHIQARALLQGERDPNANAANIASLVFHMLPDLNWAGFYWRRRDELVLGPFQGKPACVRIPIGKGVCGTAARDKRTVLVPDVEKFPGHIACDSASRSEIVVPVMRTIDVLGVLDVDSPSLARFDADDAAGLEELVSLFVLGTDFLI